MSNFQNKSKVGGAAALNVGGALQFLHCSFVDNEATYPCGGGALFVLGAAHSGASGYVANLLFRGHEQVFADPEREFEVFFTHSIVPPDLFEQSGFRDVGGNTLGAPQLETVSPGLFSLKPGTPGAGTANLKFSDALGVDLLGRPLVRRGAADPGAIARAPG